MKIYLLKLSLLTGEVIFLRDKFNPLIMLAIIKKVGYESGTTGFCLNVPNLNHH
jgi:hypothetical protein